MDPTRIFLLNQMATASSLEEFYLAYQALNNLNRLLAQSTQAQRGPVPGVYTPNQGFNRPPQGPPPGPRPFQGSEPSWGENDEQMPWEGGQ